MIGESVVKKIKVILIGAGNRGMIYTDIMSEMSDKFEVVAVAEPIASRREYIKEKHSLAEDMCFDDWHPLLQKGKIADIAIIATMDRDHYAPSMKAIELGYDLLLEKPISDNPEECKNIANAADEAGVRVVICTVLRYTPFFMRLKKIITDGEIGDIISIDHEECVGNIHQSHSFVRGNWGNEERSSCMLLQKCCHDMDIIQWLIDKPLKKVQSYGALSHFTKKNAPAGSPDYCIDGCPEADTCFYNSVKLYLDDKKNDWFRSTCTQKVNPTDADVEKALRTTQYGKCVYKCDNDVVDHQTVNMLFGDDVTVTFTMNAFNFGGRFIHIMGTKGEIHGSSDGGEIKIFDFATREEKTETIGGKDGIKFGHGGGDEGIVSTIYDFLTDNYSGNSIPSIKQSKDNHLIVFAAEKSRKENIVVDFEEFIS